VTAIEAAWASSEVDQRTASDPGPATDARSSGVPGVLRPALALLSALLLGFVLYLAVGSRLEEAVDQSRAFTQLRNELALGTAPLGPRVKGRPIASGSPIALLQIPSLGLRQVVGEGTSGAALALGPGHLRTSVFPGGTGTSVIFGREATYGGPFGRIGSLRHGALITVRTGAGLASFRVVDVRRAGTPVPALARGAGRLTLVSAAGPSLFPTGVVRVDADLVGTPFAAARPLSAVGRTEVPMASDPSAWRGLALGFELLALALAAAVWTWHRRGHAQAWIIFSAPVLGIALFLADQGARLLPNLT